MIKRIILIGDSIAQGYFEYVIKSIKFTEPGIILDSGDRLIVNSKFLGSWDQNGRSCLFKMQTNTKDITQLEILYLGNGTTRKALDLIKTINLSNEDFIHLNCGLHDLGRPEPLIKNMLSKKQVNITEYAENLEKIFAFIRNKEAVVLWGSTTPVEERSVFRNRGWQQRLTKDVELYNIVAKRICHERNIQINDIYAKILPEHKHLLLKDGVHFSEEGYKVLGKIVSESIVQVFEDLFK